LQAALREAETMPPTPYGRGVVNHFNDRMQHDVVGPEEMDPIDQFSPISLEALLMQRRGRQMPLEEHVTSQDMETLGDYGYGPGGEAMVGLDRQAYGLDSPRMEANFLEGELSPQQPQPGTPEFYEWLMSRVG
jgi:hypothetical protein